MADKKIKNAIIYGITREPMKAAAVNLQSNDTTTLKHRCEFSNARYFDGTVVDVDLCIIEGDFPKIAKAYEEAKIKVGNCDDYQEVAKPAPKKPAKVKEAPKAPNDPEAQETPVKSPESRTETVSRVDIPEDWEKQPFMAKRALAHKIAGNTEASNGDEVKAVIEEEIKSRG